MCATEKRRRRKRNLLPELTKRTLINTAVCEGCGDCSKQSNCLSIEPIETPLGTKRQINQSTCNQDLSCVKGFCPSFVTIEGGALRKPNNSHYSLPYWDELPPPTLPSLDKPYRILITGVGGTGIVTVGALLGMAAHLEHKGVTVLDMAGLAQKGGAVLSHVQIAREPYQLNASKIATGEANLLLGCDAIVSASQEALSMTLKGLTHCVVNSSETPTAEFITNHNWSFPGTSITHDLTISMGNSCEYFNANDLALKLLGDTLFANIMLVGYAWQKGWIPLKRDSIMQAIYLNGTQPEKNEIAFTWGSYFAVHHNNHEYSTNQIRSNKSKWSLDELTVLHHKVLTDYQNAAYAYQYDQILKPLREAETRLNIDSTLPLTTIAAKNLVHLMAYKDEYEVARLYITPEFKAQLAETFEGEIGKDYQLKLNLSPPFFTKLGSDGKPRKQQYGTWLYKAFPLLAKLKVLRGTPLDVFGYTQERKQERALVKEYSQLIQQASQALTVENYAKVLDQLKAYEQIRGYGYIKEAYIQDLHITNKGDR
jgi:indolepyruvate ferredoxin oxidoreductase